MTPRLAWGRFLKLGLVGQVALILATCALPSQVEAAPPKSRVPVVHYKERSFRIPFNPVEPTERARLKEVVLWASDDQGYTWQRAGRTTPDRPSFTYKAAHDGEWCFALGTINLKGQMFPTDKSELVTNLRVVVDTIPPSLALEARPRRGTIASVRWEVRDEHLEIASLYLEYLTEGSSSWKQAPLRRPALIGAETWDVGTSAPLRVRLSVSDRAGNLGQELIQVGSGDPEPPTRSAAAAPDFESLPPPILPISQTGPSTREIRNEPNSAPAEGMESDLAPVPLSGGPPSALPVDEPASMTPNEVTPTPVDAPPAKSTPPGSGKTKMVGSPKFGLQYAVDDAGPNGASSVELWVTNDGGRTWSRRGEDPDRVSPFPVDLGGEGTYGLSLVARAASGLGDQPPAPGDPPQFWVEVDSSPPTVQLDPPQVGTGTSAGKVVVTWRATDLHLADRPIMISYRPDVPGATWQPVTGRIENTGRFVWQVPANYPPKFHLRVDAVDAAGHKGHAETTTTGPVFVDRTRPKSRILGLDVEASPRPR